jgi:ketosteroid isomerase-like protein
MIYRSIVERKLRGAFDALNRGDHGPVLAAFGAPVEHVFYGRTALGGARHEMRSIVQWYARLKVLMPDLKFDIEAVAVTGPPWNTVALIEWRDHFSLPDGSRRANQGVHALRLRWGKVVSLRVYCDTQLLADILREMQSQRLAEAGAAPIADGLEDRESGSADLVAARH